MIKIAGAVQADTFKSFIQKQANSLGIEGTVQHDGEGLVVYACGLTEKLDQFIDSLYKGLDKSKLKNVTVEPFVSEKDFRGVFRVIG